MARNRIRLNKNKTNPPNRMILRGRVECSLTETLSGVRSAAIGGSGGGSITPMAARDDAGTDHAAEFVIPARVSAAAIFCCWLMSELFVGPECVERWMTSCVPQHSAGEGSQEESGRSEPE